MFRPNLLCIVPPFGNRPPAGAAYLLGHLEAQGCHDFDFVDLRLGAPFDYAPTYRAIGAFGESFVIDVPDLPLILMLLEAFRAHDALAPRRSPLFDRYCLERGMSPHSMEHYIQSMDRYLGMSLDQLPKVEFIGFSVWSTNLYFTLLAAAHLKRRRSPPLIIAGGPQVTSSRASAELALRAGLFDVIALGDGEETLLDLYRAFRLGQGIPRSIEGTVTLDVTGKTMQRLERKLHRMKEIARPSFDKIPMQAYQDVPTLRALPLQFSRGCTDRCTFCSEWVFWQRFRPDYAENTVEHIKELKGRYNCDFIDFSDSLMNGVPKRLNALAELLISQNVEVGWTAFMRARMEPETATLIARAGCTGVFVGVESFSDETLDLMKKRRTEADNIQAVRSFLSAGIYVTAGFIPGFPGDTRHGFLHSVEVARRLQDEYPGMLRLHEEPFTVMASAPMYDQLETFGLRPIMWDPEYIDISPTYADITSKIICHVEGNGQGVERIGRMMIVGAVKSVVGVAIETDTAKAGAFEERHDDDLKAEYFIFDHLLSEWYRARIKSTNGHRYSLLVTEKEKAKLENFQVENFPLGNLLHSKATGILSSIESAHIIRPSRKRQSISRGLYVRDTPSDSLYGVSPNIIARTMGAKHRHRVLFLNTMNRHVIQRSRIAGQVVERLGSRKMTIKQVLKAVCQSDPELTIAQLSETLEDLKEAGILSLFSARKRTGNYNLGAQMSRQASPAVTPPPVITVADAKTSELRPDIHQA